MTRRATGPVLLLGWDAADWKLIHPLLDRGEMPNLSRLIDGGVMGNLETLTPSLSPVLWSSIATGKHGDEHGILGFVEPRADGRGIQPVSSRSRRCKAIWNILREQGLRANVVNWYASHPAEPVDGCVVSNLFAQAIGRDFDSWPLPPGSVYPPEQAGELSELRVHPSEVLPEQIQELVPRAAEVDQRRDPRLAKVAENLARLFTVHAAGTHLAARGDWDFLAVYYEAIDHFCHDFMELRSPRLEHVSERENLLYGDVVDRVYRYHDLLLGRYMELVPRDTTILLISDHGFRADHARPRGSSSMDADPLAWHRDFGIFVAAGPDLKMDERAYGLGLLDVAPTILALLGVPVPDDMDGRVLTQLWRRPPEIERVASHEGRGAEARPVEADPVESADLAAQGAVIQQLAALGYLDEQTEDAERAIAKANESRLATLAQIHFCKGDYRRAMEAYRALEELAHSEAARGQLRLRVASCLLGLRELESCRQILDELRTESGDSPEQLGVRGRLQLAQGNAQEAKRCFEKTLASSGEDPGTLHNLAICHIELEEWVDAEAAARRMLEHDDEEPRAWHLLGLAQLRQQRPDEASESLMRSVSLRHINPLAHYQLGIALAKLGQVDWSARALEISLEQNPAAAGVHLALSRLYEQTGKPLRADFHRRQAEALMAPATEREEPATSEAFARDSMATSFDFAPGETAVIVSGLPRSGTSLMMQMLEAGGLPILTDGVRRSDPDNPKGYLEWEPIKRVQSHPALVDEARGKAVKTISMLLLALPANHRYKVIFMERDLREVLRSQSTMLGHGRPEDVAAEEELFARHLRGVRSWLTGQPNMHALFVSHRDALSDPLAVAQRVNEFLGGGLNDTAMAGAVDRALYRQREPTRGPRGSTT